MKTTWQISLNKLAELLFKYLTKVHKLDKAVTAETIAVDLLVIEGRRIPPFLSVYISDVEIKHSKLGTKKNKRQIMHL